MSDEVVSGSKQVGADQLALIAPELRDARQIDKLPAYLAEVWRRRGWCSYVAVSELRSRQINSVLGNVWHVLSPLLQIAVFYIFFGLVLDVERGVDNFVGYLTVGIFIYGFTQKTVTNGGGSMIKYRRLMQMITFPRALIPLTTTLTETLAMIPTYAVMFIVLIGTGERPQWTWLFLVPLFVLQAVFGAGCALVAARAVSHLYDVQQILPFFFRLGFYASGVLFDVNEYIEGKSWRTLFELNPIYCFIELNRSALLTGRTTDWSLAVNAAVWTVLAAVVGVLWFRSGEEAYGEV